MKRRLVRLGVAVMLTGICGTARAAGDVAGLKKDLSGADDLKAEDAAKKLGDSADPKALDTLLDGLALGAPPRVQAAMLGSLQGKKDPRAIEVLKHYAKNRNPELRKKAVTALGGVTDKRVVPTLIAALSDSVPEVRAAGAEALGKRRERSAEPQLLKLLQHKDAAAPGALALLATPELARRLSEMLGQVPDSLLCNALGEILKRPDFGPEPIRLEIVKTLSKVPGIDSTAALVEYLAATQKDKARGSRVEAQRIVDQRSNQ
jgi:HEAT repeat protein